MVVELSKQAIKQGFRIEKGLLVKYILDSEGNLIRKRKNWKSSKRAYSRQFLEDSCSHCSAQNNLTIHHKIPISLGGSKEKENCITLCKDCHVEIHKKLIKGVKKVCKQESFLVLEKGLWGEYRIVD